MHLERRNSQECTRSDRSPLNARPVYACFVMVELHGSPGRSPVLQFCRTLALVSANPRPTIRFLYLRETQALPIYARYLDLHHQGARLPHPRLHNLSYSKAAAAISTHRHADSCVAGTSDNVIKSCSDTRSSHRCPFYDPHGLLTQYVLN